MVSSDKHYTEKVDVYRCVWCGVMCVMYDDMWYVVWMWWQGWHVVEKQLRSRSFLHFLLFIVFVLPSCLQLRCDSVGASIRRETLYWSKSTADCISRQVLLLLCCSLFWTLVAVAFHHCHCHVTVTVTVTVTVALTVTCCSYCHSTSFTWTQCSGKRGATCHATRVPSCCRQSNQKVLGSRPRFATKLWSSTVHFKQWCLSDTV